jgi:Tol biopolymer transport system component
VRVADNTEVIHWINLDGTGDEALTPPGTKTIHPTFSPDGKLLAYCTDDDLQPPKKNDSDIYMLDLASRQPTKRITGGTNTYPRFSPDGKRFAFRRMTGEINSEVFVADLDGSHAKNLSNNPWFDGWPAWSPDGAWIAFASNCRQNYQIYVMRPDGSDVRLVAPTEGRATAPVWTRDGQHIDFPNAAKSTSRTTARSSSRARLSRPEIPSYGSGRPGVRRPTPETSRVGHPCRWMVSGSRFALADAAPVAATGSAQVLGELALDVTRPAVTVGIPELGEQGLGVA